jgi:glycosyltransferase involved in cell wall biosynthesis
MKTVERSRRVLVLADVPIWTLPGLERFARTGPYATWLKSLVPEFEGAGGLELHWVVFSKEVDHPFTHRVWGQSFHVLPRWKKLLSMVSGYHFEVRRIQSVCDEVEPDLIHAWGSEDVYGWACRNLRFGGARLFTLQGCLTEYLRIIGGGGLFRLQAAYEKPTIRSFSVATAESPQAADLLRAIQPEIDVTIIDYGVDQLFHDQEWSPCREPTLVWVGAVTSRKGILDAVEAFSRSELSHVKLQIVGEGDLLEEMRQKATANVEWLGKLDRIEVAAKLAGAWGFLMPTHADTGPTVVKEARVVGLPVITTTAAGASCYIEDGRSGHVIEPGDVDAMVEGVRNLSSSLDRCLEMGRFHWQETRSSLRSEATAAAFADLYRRLVT